MLRELNVHAQKAAPANYKAAVAVSTSSAVVKNNTSSTFAFPAAATASDLCFVQKARIPTGANASRTEFSDYEVEFNSVKKGEPAVLYTYDYGEVFGVSEYDAATLMAANQGKRVMAGKDGKLTVSTVASKYIFEELYTENGHKLAKISVSDTPITNV